MTEAEFNNKLQQYQRKQRQQYRRPVKQTNPQSFKEFLSAIQFILWYKKGLE